MNFYNDNDPSAAYWLQSLIDAELIQPGVVDERSIADIKPAELSRFIRCHFFAGIGGWDYALRLAGWPEGRPVWTGSCPCQPFSSAGARRGVDDERHLWPAFRWLIAQRRPATIFGEQVASSDGREWLAGVFSDLEALGYVCAGADLPAAGVAAPHRRSRLFWVADADFERVEGYGGLVFVDDSQGRESEGRHAGASGVDVGVAHPEGDGREQGRTEPSRGEPACGHWGDDWFIGADGKARRLKPGLELLVDGLPGRVAQLRGLGNAIVPQVAAEFIKACL